MNERERAIDIANEVYGVFIEAGRPGALEWGVVTIADIFEKALEAAHREEQKRLQKILDNAPVGHRLSAIEKALEG